MSYRRNGEPNLICTSRCSKNMIFLSENSCTFKVLWSNYLKVCLSRAFSLDLLCLLRSKKIRENDFLTFIMFHVIPQTFSTVNIKGTKGTYYITSSIDAPKRKSRITSKKDHHSKSHKIRSCPHPIWRLFCFSSRKLAGWSWGKIKTILALEFYITLIFAGNFFLAGPGCVWGPLVHHTDFH